MTLSNKVEMDTNGLLVPDNVTIPFIEGDGIGKDIWAASSVVINSAVEKAYKVKYLIFLLFLIFLY